MARENTEQRLLRRLDVMRADLCETAFSLEQSGRRDAADVALVTSARLGELCAEFAVNDSFNDALLTQPPSA